MKKMGKKNENLTEQNCVPCKEGIPPISEKKANDFLRQISGWNLIEEAKKIQKEFEFKNFEEAVSFVKKIAVVCEEQNHHPDIFISFNKVIITNYSHKIGGLHENDFILAGKIDKILN